jgi:1-acyl-sn-glycerol-3-phosphate acyltransferase
VASQNLPILTALPLKLLMNNARAAWKLARLAGHLASGLWTMRFVLPALDPAEKEQTIQAWALAALGLLAIDLSVVGQPRRAGPVLRAANHISWLDILVLQATCPSRFVAKAEVRHWPLMGRLASNAGTLFISRESPRDALRVVQQMAEHLKAGEVLTIFPEGTTSNGRQVLPFHANLFQAAVSANAPVLPVALQFVDRASGQHNPAASYIDDDTLLQSMWRTARHPGLRAVVRFGSARRPQGRDRRALAQDTRSEVEALRG